jgi:hypothetical protein
MADATAPNTTTGPAPAVDTTKPGSGAATAPPPAGSPQPAPATGDTSKSFLDKSDAEIAAMSKEDQDQYYAAYNAAQNGTAAGTPGAPTPPTEAQVRSGNLTQEQINALPYQEQQQYLYRRRTASKDDTFGPSTYVAPPPAKASDYVSDQHFVSQVGETDAQGNPVIDPATGKQKTHAASTSDIVGPQKWDVTSEQTVQGQMKQLTTNLQSNPVYQSLAEEMKRVNAAAGGGNSLMAESAAYDKVIGLAFNIASSDAATYAKSAEFNATMANQFGLAKNNFVYQALLSDQNYAQSQVLQSNQIKGNLDSMDRQISGQLESTKIAGKAQIKAAQAQAGAMVASANIQADASMKNAELGAKTQLQLGDQNRQNTLDTLKISHESRMAEIGYQGDYDMNKLMASGAMDFDKQAAFDQDQLVKSVTINDQIGYNNNLTAGMTAIQQMFMQPGITPEQAARYINTITTMTKTDNELLLAKTNAITASIGTSGTGTAGGMKFDPSKYADYVTYKPKTTELPFFQESAGGYSGMNASASTKNPFLPTMPVGG